MNPSIIAIAVQKETGAEVVLKGSPKTTREIIEPVLSRLGVRPQAYDDKIVVGLPSGAATHFMQSVKLLANLRGVRMAVAA